MSRRRLLSADKEIVSVLPSKAEACDAVFANKSTEELVIVRNEKDWPSASKWEPIGIVVIPGEHGVLKDGSGKVNQCGVMSLVAMRCDVPETGMSKENSMYWGCRNIGISGKSDGLNRYDSITNGLLDHGEAVQGDVGLNNATGFGKASSYIPIQKAVREDASQQGQSGYAPSPYIGDGMNSGGYNEAYGTTKFNTVEPNLNCLSDFKGIINTKIITDLVTVSNWKTIDFMPNSYAEGNYPAACCCARFHTVGTKAFVDCSIEELREGSGFWYLPAMGELGYIIPRVADINDTIRKLNRAYGIGVELANMAYGINCYWSSTEYSADRVNIMQTSDGWLRMSSKEGGFYVRAFMRLSDPPIELTDVYQLDQSISDPTRMLTGTLGKDGTPETNTVAWIRANSHRFKGTYEADRGMVLKQLDDGNSDILVDGTPLDVNIGNTNIWMKMPTFWFKGTPVDSNNEKCNIHFTNIEPTTEGWTKWDGNTLIGVYKASTNIPANTPQGWLYSLPNMTPAVSASQANFKTKARYFSNDDDHFMLVTYEAHQVMALLYMCYYGNMNGQAVCGRSNSTYPKITGASNSLGMADTTVDTSTSLGVVNFWGLENWWGDIYEWVDNLQTNTGSSGNGKVAILDYNGAQQREVAGCLTGYTNISKMALGGKVDMLPVSSNNAGSTTIGYCDYGNVTSSSGYIGYRSYYGSYTDGGPFFLSVNTSASSSLSSAGSRLMYHGRVVIDD